MITKLIVLQRSSCFAVPKMSAKVYPRGEKKQKWEKKKIFKNPVILFDRELEFRDPDTPFKDEIGELTIRNSCFHFYMEEKLYFFLISQYKILGDKFYVLNFRSGEFREIVHEKERQEVINFLSGHFAQYLEMHPREEYVRGRFDLVPNIKNQDDFLLYLNGNIPYEERKRLLDRYIYNDRYIYDFFHYVSKIHNKIVPGGEIVQKHGDFEHVYFIWNNRRCRINFKKNKLIFEDSERSVRLDEECHYFKINQERSFQHHTNDYLFCLYSTFSSPSKRDKLPFQSTFSYGIFDNHIRIYGLWKSRFFKNMRQLVKTQSLFLFWVLKNKSVYLPTEIIFYIFQFL
jgi:hypothetical protein